MAFSQVRAYYFRVSVLTQSLISSKIRFLYLNELIMSKRKQSKKYLELANRSLSFINAAELDSYSIELYVQCLAD